MNSSLASTIAAKDKLIVGLKQHLSMSGLVVSEDGKFSSQPFKRDFGDREFEDNELRVRELKRQKTELVDDVCESVSGVDREGRESGD